MLDVRLDLCKGNTKNQHRCAILVDRTSSCDLFPRSATRTLCILVLRYARRSHFALSTSSCTRDNRKCSSSDVFSSAESRLRMLWRSNRGEGSIISSAKSERIRRHRLLSHTSDSPLAAPSAHKPHPQSHRSSTYSPNRSTAAAQALTSLRPTLFATSRWPAAVEVVRCSSCCRGSSRLLVVKRCEAVGLV